MNPIELKVGAGAGSLFVESYSSDGREFSLNLRPSHGGPEYRIVRIQPHELADLTIALCTIPAVRDALEAVRTLVDKSRPVER